MASTPGNPFKPAALNNNVYYSSGLAIIPTSGAPTASGPWMEEHQDLTVHYARVPWAYSNSQTVSLSGASQAYAILQTRLAMYVTAHYRKEKTYIGHNDPSPSGYQQTQKFQINAVSADHNGVTYGDLSAGASGTAMGPVGTIITSQPWYQRRKWDADIDTEVTRSMTGYLFYGVQLTTAGYTYMGNAQQDYMNDFLGHAVAPGQEGCFVRGQQHGMPSETKLGTYGGLLYALPGPYSTAQETIGAIFELIDGLGSNVTNVDFIPYIATDTPNFPGLTEGFVEYSINRHDYTA